MTKVIKIIILSLLLVSLTVIPAHAQEVNPNCSPVYGGGQICGDYTPAPTGLDTSSLPTGSLGLFSLGLISFTLSQKVKQLIPRK